MKTRDTDADRDDSPPSPGQLVGRQRELAEARAMVDTGLAGAGGLLLVSGEAGIGKTRFVEELAAGVRPRARVLWGACWADPGTPAYWPWRGVLQAAEDPTPAGDVLAPILGRVGREATGPAEQLRLQLFDAVAMFLHQASRVRPQLVVIEDLHLADAASLDLLRFLAIRLRGHPVVLVGTHRPADGDPGAPLADTLAELGRTGRTVTLFGLPPRQVGELVWATTGTAPDPASTGRIHQHTGGNPLFVIEVARLLAAGDVRDGDDLPIPPRVQQVIGQRAGRVRPDVVDLLAQAAVCGLEFSEVMLVHVADRDPTTVADLLDEATGAGLVRPMRRLHDFAFAHAIVRDVLYAGMPAALRRDRHRRTAEAIEHVHARDLDEHLGELAHHHVLALPDTDVTRALDLCRRAGLAALRRLAPAEAERHLARAIELAEEAGIDEAERVELLLHLGDARLRAGDWHAAADAYEAVAASARRRQQPAELARAALGLGAGLSGVEVRLFDQRQIDLLQEALEALGDEESALRTWVLARLSVAEAFVVSDQVRVARSREALDAARRGGDPKLLSYTLSSYCDAIPGPEHTEERLRLATEMVRLGVESADPESELLGRRFRVVALLEAGDLDRIDDEIVAFERTAQRLRWPLVEWYPPLWHGTRALISGRLDEAAQLTATARHIGEQGGSVNAGIVSDVQRIQWLLEQGRPAEVYDLLGRFLDDPEGGPNAEAWLALPLARMGHHVEARAVLDRLAARGFPLVRDGAWLEVIASVAEACAELRHRDAAARLLPLLEPFADRFATGAFGAICLGSLHRHVGLLAHCSGRLDQAHASFRRALAVHRRIGATLLVAHTLRQYAAVLTDRDQPGDRAAADAMLEEATHAYGELGLDHWVRAADRPMPDPSALDNHLRREGEVWAVRYAGLEARVRHAKGMTVLARLLAEPGREFHVLDLAGAQGAAAATISVADTGEVIDAQARAAYRRRLAELEEYLSEATSIGDLARVDRSQQERDALVEQLTAAYGLGGRVRHGNDPVERARSTVTKQVRGAIQRIAAVHPQLARHLENTVRTGRYCSYVPEGPVHWGA